MRFAGFVVDNVEFGVIAVVAVVFDSAVLAVEVVETCWFVDVAKVSFVVDGWFVVEEVMFGRPLIVVVDSMLLTFPVMVVVFVFSCVVFKV